MKQVAGCDDGNCPKWFEDLDHYVIQGYTVDPAELGGLPTGESAVRIPRSLVEEFLRKEGR